MNKRPPKPELPVVVLTPEQKELAEIRADFEESHAIITERFRVSLKRLMDETPKCKDHVWRVRDGAKYEWFGNRWHLSESVFCAICGKHGGWFCPVNPTRQCEYNNGDDESCDHCGYPDERK